MPEKSVNRYEQLWELLRVIYKSQSNATALSETLGWPLPTIKNRLQQLKSMGVDIKYIGSKRNGFYVVRGWGPINRDYVLKK